MRSAGVFGAVLLFQLSYAAIVVGIPLLLGIALAWWTTRPRDTVAAGQLRRARTARLLGLGVGALVGLLMVLAAKGFLAPIAVVAGYLVGVLNSEVRDAPAPTGTVRVASLRPRTVRHYVPRWATLVTIGAAAVTVLAPAIFAALPTVTYGPYHPFPDDPGFTLPGAALKWPSIVEWLPLGLVAGGAPVVGVLLVQRLLRLPADPSGVGEPRRHNAIRTITGTVVGVELVALGALLLYTSAGLAVPAEIGGASYLGSRIMIWTGLGLAVAGIVTWLAMSTRRRDPLVADTVSQK